MPHDSTARAAARERGPSDGTGLMTGFPPGPEAQVTLANWQDPPYSRWAFRHMRELIPSHPIPAGPPGGLGGIRVSAPPGASRAPAPLPAAPWPLPDPPVRRIDGSTATAAEVFADTYTDALVVLKDGQLVAERYEAGVTAATVHLLMSVSKSLVGGWYRNQFWVIPGPGGPVLVCLGIHGQLVYADRAAQTVVVKLSSWPDPQHTGYLLDTLRACAALAAGLSAGGL